VIEIKEKLVSVVIPTHNRKNMLFRLIKSIKKSTYKNIEIIIVDDNSNDGTYDLIKKYFYDVKIIRNKTSLFSTKSRNLGLKYSKGKYIFFIDDDNVVEKNCIKNLVKVMENDRAIGMVGPLMLWYRKKDIIWCAGGSIPFFWLKSRVNKLKGKNIKNVNIPEKIYDIDFFPNSFMLRKKDALKVCFNEKIFPHNWSEVEWGLNLKKMNYKIATVTKARVWHDIPYLERKITRIGKFFTYDQSRSRIIFLKKYGNIRDKIIFIITFLPTTLYYLYKIFTEKTQENKIEIFISYFKGSIDGLVEK